MYAIRSYYDANLQGADLRGANMFRAKLHQAQDLGAQFSDRARALGDDPEQLASERWRPAPRA